METGQQRVDVSNAQGVATAADNSTFAGNRQLHHTYRLHIKNVLVFQVGLHSTTAFKHTSLFYES